MVNPAETVSWPATEVSPTELDIWEAIPFGTPVHVGHADYCITTVVNHDGSAVYYTRREAMTIDGSVRPISVIGWRAPNMLINEQDGRIGPPDLFAVALAEQSLVIKRRLTNGQVDEYIFPPDSNVELINAYHPPSSFNRFNTMVKALGWQTFDHFRAH